MIHQLPRLTLLMMLTQQPLALAQTIAQDCETANIIWQKMGKTTTIPSDCCSPTYGITCSSTRIIAINWMLKGLKGSIPPEIGNLTALDEISMHLNQLTGPLPSTLTSLQSLQYLRLSNNKLSDPIPSFLGSLANLKRLWLTGNPIGGTIPSSFQSLTKMDMLVLSTCSLNGTIPAFLGSMPSLMWLVLDSNQLTGPIPSALGSLKKLVELHLYNNQLTGYPSTLRSAFPMRIFPNPMSSIPYDLVMPASVGTLSNVTWEPFLSTPVALRKRQLSSAQSSLSTEELIKLCPFNSVQSADLVAGCIAGIYTKFCSQPGNPVLLGQCHDHYNRVFAASFFKPLGDVCPAWKNGPRSKECTSAVVKFSHNLLLGYGSGGAPLYLMLGSSHAAELVRSIFASRTWAPCVAPFTCSW